MLPLGLSKSSLARANQDRDYRIFEEYAFYLVSEVRKKYCVDIIKLEGSEIPYETSSYYIFDRAYNKFSQLFSINQIGAYFVVRARRMYSTKL